MAIEDNTVYGLTGAQIKELPGKIEAVKGKAKVLTTADYNANRNNWTDTDPANFNCIALWKLDAGVYNLETGLSGTASEAYLAARYNYSIVNKGPIWIGESRNGDRAVREYLYYNGNWNVASAWCDTGEIYSTPRTITTSIVDNLTSVAANMALSANQGRVLKGLIDAIVVPTKTSDLTNDSNFVTATEMDTALADKADANDIPTALSELTNDINAVSDANYVHTDNNYTTPEKTKLAGIATGAEVNVQANWAETDTTADSYIQNKPTIPAAQIQSDWNQTSTVALDYIKNKPTLATVATTGSYSDLANKPTIPVVHNATLTIQQNGTTVGTFTANSSTATTVDIETPAVFTTNEWNALWA